MNNILKRYSCRSFTDKKIDEKDINTLLISAMQAPSACNQQPWEFIVVDDKNLLKQLSKASRGAWMLADADKAIIVVMTSTEPAPHMRPQDCAAATQNILLEVTNLGLGAVWIGVYPLEERMSFINPILNVTDDKTVFSMIAIGHPTKEKDVVLRYDANRIYRNKM